MYKQKDVIDKELEDFRNEVDELEDMITKRSAK